MVKLFILTLIISLLIHCSPKEQQKEAFSDEGLNYTDTTQFFLNAKSRLNKLLENKDSLKAYIRLNSMLYDSLAIAANFTVTDFFLENIINSHSRIVGDTALKKILAKAYFRWAEKHYTEQYNDTLVYRLEQFLLLTKDRKPTHPLSPYAYQYLGIQYHVLGDLKKCNYYYFLFLQYAKREGNIDLFSSGAVDASIALNEMQLYDSSINLINPLLPKEEIRVKRKINLLTSLAKSYAGKGFLTKSYAASGKALLLLNKITINEIDSSELLNLQYQSFLNIGGILISTGQIGEATTVLRKAEEYLKIINNNNIKNRESGKLYLSIGRSAEAAGELGKALTNYHKALYCVSNIDSVNLSSLPSEKDLYKENTIMEALDAKADVLKKLYKRNNNTELLKQGVECYRLAFIVENKLLMGYSYDESLARQAVESKKRSEKAIAICFLLYKSTKEIYWAESAFTFAEKSKAIALQESIKRNISTSKNLLQDTNWQKVQFLQQQVWFYEKELALIAKTDSIKIKRLSGKQDETNKRLLFAKTELQHNNSMYRESLLQEDSISISLSQNKLLNNRTSLVEFFTGDSSTFIFIVSKNSPVLFVKADSTLPGSTKQLLSFFTDKNKINNAPDAYQLAAFNLYKKTFLSGINNKEITELLIIPDGILNSVPFEALITDIAKEQSLKQFNYLLNLYNISYGYSASTLIKQQESKSNNGPLLCMAPVFANNERGNTTLEYSAEELGAIRIEKPSGNFFSGNAATIGQFKEYLSSSSIVHIASHAHADTSATGIQPRIEFYDSTLYLNELYTMHINPRLVVLSACETGIGIIDKSEGAMSLARGFYYAGAKNIITSLWSVDDKSTAALFSRFYADINNSNYSQALHASKLNYIKNATATNASPYYWAGFVHIGYNAPEKKKSTTLLFIATGLLLLLTSVFLYRKRK
jgi:CHAT domain-containing protein